MTTLHTFRLSFRLMLWVGLLTLLHGCSAIKLGYNKVDDMAYWWLDGYADFSQPQADRLHTALSQVHRWHREQELPVYATLLQQAQTMASDNITPEQACSLWNTVQTRIDALATKALPGLTAAALDLSPRQLAHIERQWSKKNANWQDDWLKGSVAQREQKRLDTQVDRYASFYGDLNTAQINLVRQQIQQSAWTPEWGWQDRLKKQQQLMDALRSFQIKPPNPTQAQEVLKQVFQNWTSNSTGPGYEMRQKMTEQACANLAQLHNTTTPAQRLKATQRLRAYALDFKELAMQ
jgi:hypothetical protein